MCYGGYQIELCSEHLMEISTNTVSGKSAGWKTKSRVNLFEWVMVINGCIVEKMRILYLSHVLIGSIPFHSSF